MPLRISHKDLKGFIKNPCVQKAIGSPLQRAVILLMNRDGIPLKWDGQDVSLKEEERLCVAIADRMRGHTTSGRYKGIWFHVANEGRRSILTAIILRAMGLIPGVFDYFFAGRWGCGLIEVKIPDGVVSPEQKDFQLWAEDHGVHTAICRTVCSFEGKLMEWGALMGPLPAYPEGL